MKRFTHALGSGIAFGLCLGIIPCLASIALSVAYGYDYGWVAAIPKWMVAGFGLGFVLALFDDK
mgnify:CR=1 FL=1|jgi:hypothetical protein